ncbi:hypothetical protein HWN40_05495 [Methanolobus zinderi]|jgi:hypothetical protein|uniref:Uncharacterized protein n=1 Tax=Methanolobus zinderi TaxID=536044 RepID=A0A7D5E7L0_9EURY|nr:hypothetical protein [Methanolobus zinderi]QLC49738.1 hypothetical protein HWN40_05495 [Methanolobus zinderi]
MKINNQISYGIYARLVFYVVIFALSGYVISYSGLLNGSLITNDVWYWFFSSVAQSFVAIVSVLVVVYTFNKDNIKYSHQKNYLETVFSFSMLVGFFIIFFSLMLIPFASIPFGNTYNITIKLIIIHGFLGLCFFDLIYTLKFIHSLCTTSQETECLTETNENFSDEIISDE